jgi:hypothetical protein
MPVADMYLIFVTCHVVVYEQNAEQNIWTLKKRKYWEGGGNYVTSSIIVFPSYNVVSEIKALKKIRQNVLLL